MKKQEVGIRSAELTCFVAYHVDSCPVLVCVLGHCVVWLVFPTSTCAKSVATAARGLVYLRAGAAHLVEYLCMLTCCWICYARSGYC